jgi:hypothetical protein
VSGKLNRALGALLVAMITTISLSYLWFAVDQFSRRGFEYVLVGLAAGGVFMGLLLRGPIGRAIARMLEGEPALDDRMVEQLDDFDARLAEIGLDAQRVRELEERLDFAERFLAQQQDRATFPRPGEE